MDAVGLTLHRAERQHRVVGQDQRDDDRGVPEVAVDVVEDQRQPGLAGVGLCGSATAQAGGLSQNER